MTRIAILAFIVMLSGLPAARAQESDVDQKIHEEFRWIYFPVADAQIEAMRCSRDALAAAFMTRLDDLATRAGMDLETVHQHVDEEHERMSHLSSLPCEPDKAKEAFDSVQRDFDRIEALLKQR
jgi:hypothetical protein